MSGLAENFVQKPKLLSCGHPVCTVCVGKHEAREDGILCDRCNKAGSYMINTGSFVKIITKTMIESNLEQFSRIIYDKIVSKENEITGNLTY